ncbi:Rz1-like lysis system protein LysC [Gilliamella sp. Nev3-1]|uniref:Rz1-like lysis system protein LysC n=1 Tax=Gilliamella sp. Nev3-1 TaxID=3120250 RepID=UPI003FA52DB5
MSVFLVLSLTACTTERKIYVNRPIPANLLSDCLPNLPPKSMTFGDSLKYNEHLLNVIEKCNADKRAIKEISNKNNH